MKESKITCDGCGALLSAVTQYPHIYGLSLQCADYKIRSEGVWAEYAIFMYPPIESPKDFCGFKCLKEWINKNKL